MNRLTSFVVLLNPFVKFLDIDLTSCYVMLCSGCKLESVHWLEAVNLLTDEDTCRF